MLNCRLFLLSCLVLFSFTTQLTAQDESTWTAQCLDSSNGKPLQEVIVIHNQQTYRTHENGKFTIPIQSYPVTLKFYLLGYKTKIITANNSSELISVVYLVPEDLRMQETVITTSRHEQKLEEVTQSMEVIKPTFLANTSSNEVQKAVEKLPGIMVQKDQVSIRGLSGFSYGAGSRVMVLLDEMPMLSADAGDAKWSFYPVENLDQIEIVKGAASALYGSSAMEGIIHLRTALAADTSFTEIRYFSGIYSKPNRKETADWDKITPLKYGISVARRQSFGPVKITASVFRMKDDGYRNGDNDTRIRGNMLVSYTPKNNNKWNFGGALNGSNDKGDNFLFFADVAQPYQPFPNTVSEINNTKWNGDVFAKYYPKEGTRHILRSRLFNTINKNNTNQGSHASSLFNEYQFQNLIFSKENKNIILTTGVNYILTSVNSEGLYGNHSGNNAATYLQIDSKIKKWNISLGGRMEAFKMDTLELKAFPVFRFGLNRQLIKGGFLRLSAGQGFRYPSVAELFSHTSAGAAKIFPNPLLKPESGYNVEIGYRQLYSFNNFKAYTDISTFLSEYKNMIEYTFGLYLPPVYDENHILDYLGFKALNLPHTLIKGAEFESGISYKYKKSSVGISGGYTYILPLDQDFKNIDTLERLHYLKYRRQHLVRVNLEGNYHKFLYGIYWRYNSEIKNIDEFFLSVIKGLKKDDYWQAYSAGGELDLMLGFKINPVVEITMIGKNLLNKEYMEAPGNTNIPRTINLQIKAQF